MSRRVITLVLLLALQLQGLLSYLPTGASDLAEEWAHAWLHDDGIDHHHADAQSVSVDEVGTPNPHIHHDVGHHAAMLRAPVTAIETRPRSTALFAGDDRSPPAPFLEGLLRPPRSIG